jgi:hypothetical protein
MFGGNPERIARFLNTLGPAEALPSYGYSKRRIIDLCDPMHTWKENAQQVSRNACMRIYVRYHTTGICSRAAERETLSITKSDRIRRVGRSFCIYPGVPEKSLCSTVWGLFFLRVCTWIYPVGNFPPVLFWLNIPEYILWFETSSLLPDLVIGIIQ